MWILTFGKKSRGKSSLGVDPRFLRKSHGKRSLLEVYEEEKEEGGKGIWKLARSDKAYIYICDFLLGSLRYGRLQWHLPMSKRSGISKPRPLSNRQTESMELSK